ncbi:basic blue protein-like isoform X2 [Juglans microcarpa x Juglans regia]|uniref:basic blue protein-like isoform X2 n=2 Tax=Juglans microcarpa x Juglans regia TaxID=2249226 RepID=UPI001B7F4282|nr:basic blue protein-like isoform X2 [Juglans microcarpa x Juglans regia]XP_041003669.1 basic blue protein-like isoform X2 [Juglans microcarpa x Juglans regia]
MHGLYQGRCTALVVLAITLLMTLNSLSSVSARPTIHTVGDDSGWTFNVERWTRGKRFQAGDILAFNYDPSFHNVAIVGVHGYTSCTTASSNSRTYTSGNDRMILLRGWNYFICSIPGHCQEGMRIAVYAS